MRTRKKPASFADILAEKDGANAPAAPQKAAKPLLEAWPEGYEQGSFRMVPGGVMLSAKGRPTLFIAEDFPEMLTLAKPG